MEIKNKLVILSDYGLDDAVALSWLFSHRENFSSIDVVAVAGNVSCARALENAKKLIYELQKEGGEAEINLISTLEVPQSEEDLPSIHGKDGMGDLFKNKKRYDKIKAADFNDYLKNLKNGFILLSLGPLTITKLILEKAKPSLTLIMAGVVDEIPNYNGLEFNQALDAAAYCECLKYPHLIATLDTCRHQSFNLAGFKSKETGILSKLINRSVKLAMKRHKDNSYIYDFIASLYLTNPLLFSSENIKDKHGNALTQLKFNENIENFHISALLLMKN